MQFFSRNKEPAPAEEQHRREENREKEIVPAQIENRDAEAAVPAAVAEIDPVLEKRVRRKMDMRIVPLVSALYLLSFLDRSNIG